MTARHAAAIAATFALAMLGSLLFLVATGLQWLTVRLVRASDAVTEWGMK